MKRIISVITAAVIASALLLQGAAAATGDIKVQTPGVSKAPVQDGVISDGEYGNAAPLVLDGSGKNTEGTWAGSTWGTEKFTVYSAWDEKNIYLGITVEGDTTNNQDGCPKPGDNTDPFAKCDMFQLGFNPGSIITGQMLVLFGVGLEADGKPYISADAYRSTEDGKQNVQDFDGGISAYSTKYKADGVNYVLEIAIPWTTICVKGAGRSNEGANVFDMTGELAKIKAGYEMPFFLVYTDKDASGNNIYIRTDVTTGTSWAAEGMGSIALVLGDMPAAASDNVTSSAQTLDATGLSIAALGFSALCAACVISKRRH